MESFWNIRVVLFYFILMVACNREKYVSHDALQGDWHLVEAYRGDKKTMTMSGAFFNFDEFILTSNFLGEIVQYEYKLSKNIIDISKPQAFQIQLKTLDSGKLEMKTQVQNLAFTFIVEKK